MSAVCACGKQYTRRSSLSRHKVQCMYGYYKVPRNKRKIDFEEFHLQKEVHKFQLTTEDRKENSSSSAEEEENQSSVEENQRSDEEKEQANSSDDAEKSHSTSDGEKNDSTSDSNNELEYGEDIYFGEDQVSESDKESTNSNSSDEKEINSNYYPFPNMETALIYLWAHVHPRLSIRKIQGLLDLLHTPGFTISNVPKTTYLLQKHKKHLPLVSTSKCN